MLVTWPAGLTYWLDGGEVKGSMVNIMLVPPGLSRAVTVTFDVSGTITLENRKAPLMSVVAWAEKFLSGIISFTLPLATGMPVPLRNVPDMVIPSSGK